MDVLLSSRESYSPSQLKLDYTEMKLWTLKTHRVYSPSWCHCRFCRHSISRAGNGKEEKMVKMVSCSGKHKRFAHSHNWERARKRSYKLRKITYELFTSFRLNILQMEETWTFWLLHSRTQTPNNLFRLELFLSLLATLKIDLNSAASDAEQLDTFVSFVFGLFYA